MKHFVFDIGNVLASFNGSAFIRRYVPDIADAVEAFLFPDLWNRYDQGLVSTEDMIQALCTVFPDYARPLASMMREWTDSVVICDASLEAAKRYADSRYILSNIPQDCEESLKARGLFDAFDGAICSWRERLIKPDPAIYLQLMETFDLKPEDCVFIDDRKENVEAAARLGMESHQLRDISQLPALLEQITAGTEKERVR